MKLLFHTTKKWTVRRMRRLYLADNSLSITNVENLNKHQNALCV